MEQLETARWLGNHGLVFGYGKGRKRTDVILAPDGKATMAQAAKALGCSHMMLYRMRDRGTITLRGPKGALMVPVSELWRVRSSWKALGRQTAIIPPRAAHFPRRRAS